MTRAPKDSRQSEKGAALITVLFLIVVMTSLSVALFDRVHFDILKAQGRSAASQARWFALGAEQMARKGLKDSLTLSPGKTTLNDPWAQPKQIPLPGGFLKGQLRDTGNCFNVNSLVTPDEVGVYVENPNQAEALVFLMVATGLDSTTAEEIAGRLTDWIDSDMRPVQRGAEDFDYLTPAPGYRTPNTLIPDISDLRALKGMTTTLFEAVRPVLCAHPTPNPAIINVNTLTLADAPLIVMLTGGKLTVEDAVRVLETRPQPGWQTAEEFIALPAFTNAPLLEKYLDQIGVTTRYFTLDTLVALGDAFIQLESRFDAGQVNAIRLISRRFGEET